MKRQKRQRRFDGGRGNDGDDKAAFIHEPVERISAFGVIADLKTKRLLLVHNRPHSGDGKPSGWGPPGGKAEGQETSKEAFRRESYQETGIKIESDPQLGMSKKKNPGHRVDIFIAFVEENSAPLIIGEKEEIDKVGWFSLPEIMAMPHIPWDVNLRVEGADYVFMTQREWLVDVLDSMGLLEHFGYDFGYDADNANPVLDPAAS